MDISGTLIFLSDVNNVSVIHCKYYFTLRCGHIPIGQFTVGGGVKLLQWGEKNLNGFFLFLFNILPVHNVFVLTNIDKNDISIRILKKCLKMKLKVQAYIRINPVLDINTAKRNGSCANWDILWKDLAQAAMIKVSELPKVLSDNIIKWHVDGSSYRAIIKTLNIPVSTTGLIICRWKIHGTTTTEIVSGQVSHTRFHDALSD